MARRKEIANTEIETEPKIKTINNTLRIRLDDLKTFEPLTENQKNSLTPTKDRTTSLHFTAWQVQAKLSLHCTKR